MNLRILLSLLLVVASLGLEMRLVTELAGSKSTQTRFVRDKHLLYIPSLAFLDS